jgi:hypothetical protein
MDKETCAKLLDIFSKLGMIRGELNDILGRGFSSKEDESKAEELWDYLCVQLGILENKEMKDAIRGFVELKIKLSK